MKSKEKMKCRILRKVFCYREPHALYPEKSLHHLLISAYPFRNENELLSGTPPFHQNKLLEIDIQRIANNNKVKFEPYGDLVDEVQTHYNENLINSQDPYGQN